MHGSEPDAFSVVDAVQVTGETYTRSEGQVRATYACHCPDFAGCIVIAKEKVLVCRKYAVKNPG